MATMETMTPHCGSWPEMAWPEAVEGPEPPPGKISGRGDTLSAKEFARISSFIHESSGIKLPPTKKLMVESRLRRRVRHTGFSCLEEYLGHAFGPEGKSELVHLVDAITTNRTEFFREPSHFDLLTGKVLPELLRGGQQPLKLWSAACSTGEEPYTLAMVLSEFAAEGGELRFEILASDLSTRVLQRARQAVYREEQAAAIPLRLRKKYLLRSSDPSLGLVQVSEQLRRRVAFRRLNLMEDELAAGERFHVIFCRNVLIYFAKEDQKKVMCRLHQYLVPGGFLFIGHSESMAGLGTPLSAYASAVYRRAGENGVPMERPIPRHN
ncbi:MAG: protein-glutamate O-methyltransferase CheR [Desulfobacteraceae bacterium]|nr:protein-glutamate O-methyltransferase CheR [Desulfobacteraceae bacterium]